MAYTELQVTTNFSFLRGASHPEELVQQAAEYGYKELAITDRNSFAGLVRAHSAAKKIGLRIIPACRLDLLDGSSLLAYPTTNTAYSSLCQLLTTGNLRAEKGECHLYKKDVYTHSTGIIFIALPPSILNKEFDFEPTFIQNLKLYKEVFGEHFYLAATRHYTGDDQKQLHRLWQLSASLNIPLVATNNVHYHHKSRRQLQDVLTCIREKCTIQNAGYLLHPNAERHLKTEEEMLRLFRQYPGAITHTQKIAEACQFSLDSLKYEYPRRNHFRRTYTYGRIRISSKPLYCKKV